MEQGGVRTGRSEVDADAGGFFDDAGADLEQVLPEGRKLGPGERHPAGHGIVEGEHQPVGRAVCRTRRNWLAGGLWQEVRSEASWPLCSLIRFEKRVGRLLEGLRLG